VKVYKGEKPDPQALSPRSLEELDGLDRRSLERDEVCKRLSREDQAALMARYGYEWMPVRKDVA
jgi:hypothetical protein